MYEIPSFLKKDQEALIFSEENKTLIYYIPESYFTSNLAISIGEYITLMGIFDYTIQNDNGGKNSGLNRFYFPTMFTCKPFEIEKEKQIKLKPYSKSEDYRLLKFRKGDQVVTSVKVPKTVENAEAFYKMFLYSRLPNTIPYDKLQDYFIKNIELCGANYGITIQLFGAIIGETCRQLGNKNKRFRNGSKKDKHAYSMMPIRDLPKIISPYTSITSENWDKAVIGAIQNKNRVYSPLEKLLML